jgi:oligopeptide/dipeptide ABC transporter ATP-binding protein
LTVTDSRPAVLEVDDLQVEFQTEDGPLRAVRGLSYHLDAGEVLGIVGESGSGKSVAAMALLGLLPKTARITGSAIFEGDDLVGMERAEMNAVRGKRIAMVFQDPMTSLNPVHRVGNQIAEAILAAGSVEKKEAGRRAVALLERVGIPAAASRARDYPHQFSGGMRQRAMIAMAMANDPNILIADEPTTALDVTVQAQVLETLVAAQAETKAAMILITHDLGVIANMATRVLVMYAGKAVETGSITDIFDRPRMPYTLGLLGSLPSIDSDEERLTPITGSPPSLLNLPPGCPFAPRCPMARALCIEEEPLLRPVGGPGHHAACHFAEELSAVDRPEEVFAQTAADPALVEELEEQTFGDLRGAGE